MLAGGSPDHDRYCSGIPSDESEDPKAKVEERPEENNRVYTGMQEGKTPEGSPGGGRGTPSPEPCLLRGDQKGRRWSRGSTVDGPVRRGEASDPEVLAGRASHESVPPRARHSRRWALLGSLRSRRLKRVQLRGGARRRHTRRTSCTLSVQPRALTKQMGP
jgi:hypothetical protein